MVRVNDPNSVAIETAIVIGAELTTGYRRPYADSGPWNTPIGPNPTINPDSATYIAGIPTPLSSDPTQYTYPVYLVNTSTTIQSVDVAVWFSNTTSETTITSVNGGPPVNVPIPPGAAAAAGSDQQMILWNPYTGDEWGFWQLDNPGGNWTAANGYHYNTRWSGVPPNNGGNNRFWSRGAGVPYFCGLVRPWEIAQGHIDHALAFAYNNPSSEWIYPATKSDGAGTGLPEGARLQLDPSLDDSDLAALGISGPELIIAHALQNYGMYLIDGSGSSKVMMEYEGTARWNGYVDRYTVENIPISSLRWIAGGGSLLPSATVVPDTDLYPHG